MYIKVRILVVVYNKILYSPMGFSMTSIQTGGNVGVYDLKVIHISLLQLFIKVVSCSWPAMVIG